MGLCKLEMSFALSGGVKARNLTGTSRREMEICRGLRYVVEAEEAAVQRCGCYRKLSRAAAA